MVISGRRIWTTSVRQSALPESFKDGKTSIRAGYSLAFVSEESVTVGTSVGGNAGLSTAVTLSNLSANVSQGVQVVPTPEFKTVRTLDNQIAASLTGVVRGMDESVKQPHVHQVSAGITREILWNMAVEARYVGTFGRDLFRGVDLNQLDAIGALNGAFTQDFLARVRTDSWHSQRVAHSTRRSIRICRAASR